MATIANTDIISWTSNLTLKASASATLTLSNKDDQYSQHTEDLRGQLVTISLTQNSVAYTVFKGRIQSMRFSRDENNLKTAELNLVPVSDILKNRPLTTETIDKTGTALLTYLLNTYGGLDSNYFDVSIDNGESFTDVNVSENSIYSAIKKVADAANLEAFTNNVGKFVTQLKKDENSSVDYTLTEAEVEKITESASDQFLSSVARVRGRYIIGTEDGLVTIVPEGNFGGFPRTDGLIYVNVLPAFDIDDVQALTARVDIVSGATSAVVVGRQENYITIRLEGDFTVGQVNIVTFSVKGYLFTQEDIDKATINALGTTQEFMNREDMLFALAGGMDPSLPFYLMKSSAKQINRHSNENEPTRIDEVVVDQDKISQVGMRHLEVDNVYIQDEFMAREIGERTLLDQEMGGRVFSVVTPFIPSLITPNKVVSLPLIYTSPAETVKCLVSAVTSSFEVETGKAIQTFELVELLGTSDASSNSSSLSQQDSSSSLSSQSSESSQSSSSSYAESLLEGYSARWLTPSRHGLATASGDAIAGTGVYFPGGTDYVSISGSSDFNPGSGDFRLRVIATFTAVSNVQTLFSQMTLADDDSINLRYHGGLSRIDFSTSSGAHDIYVSYALTAKQRYDIVVQKVSGVLTITINGGVIYSAADANSWGNSSNTNYIGREVGRNNDSPFKGYIAQVEFDNDSVTVLDCLNTGITDDSASAHTLTANGNAAWKSGLIGDGTGDYVSFADSDDWDLASDFDLTLYHKAAAEASARTLIGNQSSNAGWRLDLDASDVPSWYQDNVLVATGPAITEGTRTKIRVRRGAGTVTVSTDDVDGTGVGNSDAITSTGALQICRCPDAAAYSQGETDSVSLDNNGTTVLNAAFTADLADRRASPFTTYVSDAFTGTDGDSGAVGDAQWDDNYGTLRSAGSINVEIVSEACRFTTATSGTNYYYYDTLPSISSSENFDLQAEVLILQQATATDTTDGAILAWNSGNTFIARYKLSGTQVIRWAINSGSSSQLVLAGNPLNVKLRILRVSGVMYLQYDRLDDGIGWQTVVSAANAEASSAEFGYVGVGTLGQSAIGQFNSILFTNAGVAPALLDASDYLLHGSQGTAADQPVYDSTKECLTFDGTDHYDTLKAVNTDHTIFFVVDLTSHASIRPVIGDGNESIGFDASGYFYVDCGTKVADTTDHAGTKKLYTVKVDSGTATLYVNGTQVATGACGAGLITAAVLGGDGTDYFRGDLYDVGAYPSALSDADREEVEAYLTNQHSIT